MRPLQRLHQQGQLLDALRRRRILPLAQEALELGHQLVTRRQVGILDAVLIGGLLELFDQLLQSRVGRHHLVHLLLELPRVLTHLSGVEAGTRDA